MSIKDRSSFYCCVVSSSLKVWSLKLFLHSTNKSSKASASSGQSETHASVPRIKISVFLFSKSLPESANTENPIPSIRFVRLHSVYFIRGWRMRIIYIGKGCIYSPFLIKHPQPLRSYLDNVLQYTELEPSTKANLIYTFHLLSLSLSHTPNHRNLPNCQRPFSPQWKLKTQCDESSSRLSHFCVISSVFESQLIMRLSREKEKESTQETQVIDGNRKCIEATRTKKKKKKKNKKRNNLCFKQTQNKWK